MVIPARRKSGPNTTPGKARSSQNALKHGLLSRRILLQDEDPEEFQAHVGSFRDFYQPLGPNETFLVDKLIAVAWRIMRAHQVEGASMDQTYTDTLPILQHLPLDAQRERALISTMCNDNIATIRRYRTADEREYFKVLHELECAQLSRRTGTVILPGSFRVTLTVTHQLDQ